jgi:predicted nucleic acid-binding protein
VIVVEASAIVDALVGVPAHPELLAVIAEDDLHSPSLLDYEVASAFRGHVFSGNLSRRAMTHAVEDFSALQISRYPLGQMVFGVLQLRDNYTVYDAAYVALAQVLDAPLVTADAKLAEAGKLGVEVRVFRA